MNVHTWLHRSLLQSAVVVVAVAIPMVSSAVTLLNETFEGAFPEANGWAVGDANGTNGAAYWNDVNSSYGGEGTRNGGWKGYCAAVGRGGSDANPTYQNFMSAYMSKTINLTGYSSASLTFWFKIPSIEANNYDKLRVYVDNTLVWQRSTAQTYWSEVSLSLSSYVGGTHTIKFEFYSDYSGVAEGAYLDDIRVEAIVGTTLLYETFEGAFPEANGWTVGDANGTGGAAYWDDRNSDYGGEGTLDGSWKGYCAAVGRGGSDANPTYQNYMSAYMSKSVNLSGYSSAMLSFWYKIPSIEAGNWDKLRVYVGSTLVWERSTAQASWTEVNISLNGFVGASRVIKFEFSSDYSGVSEGVYLDHIRVTAGERTDIYEVDDSATTAKYIYSGQTQNHNIHIVGNKDWATFTLSSITYVNLRTGPWTNYTGGDTVMYLYGPNNSATLITSNDDSNNTRWSQIARWLAPGTYYVRVEDYNNDGTILGYTLAR